MRSRTRLHRGEERGRLTVELGRVRLHSVGSVSALRRGRRKDASGLHERRQARAYVSSR